MWNAVELFSANALVGPSLGEIVLPPLIYEQMKFWLPLVSAFVLAYKGFQSIKSSIDGWAAKLFDNHLSHIQTATMSTVTETKTTNDLLKAAALKGVEVATHVADVKKALADSDGKQRAHEEKEMMVWQGVVNTLTVLEDRSRMKTPRRRR